MGTVEVSYPDAASTAENRRVLLVESAEIYELYIISLYDLDGQLVQGIDGVPESLDIQFFTLLKETDNASRRPTNRSLSSVMNDISTNHSKSQKSQRISKILRSRPISWPSTPLWRRPGPARKERGLQL